MNSTITSVRPWIELLRWNRPTGRLILLIPAGWSLWLTPTAPPSLLLTFQILVGGLAVSAAGCIVNDLWDQHFDRQVARTQERPLARGALGRNEAIFLLCVLLILSFVVVLLLPYESRILCLILAVAALPPILIYPSAKRWFVYPQAVLALCWGFAVLIPWAAAEATLNWSPALIGCWIATLLWTFGFDTVYAMADQSDDAKIGLRSSALSLGQAAVPVIRICYGFTCFSLAVAAASNRISATFWPFWLIATVLMQVSCIPLMRGRETASTTPFIRHFNQQVQIGALILVGLVLARGLS
ncbi:4-hydroxybenzoate polyprenyltransferase [Synechococcus sp. M16CYN]|uniref:4-hydroxybenzoate polyprenyltransferase n=1 Tax=Synechococcus sp. M16CYN TaxID=3103139 RepID=UPI00324AF215